MNSGLHENRKNEYSPLVSVIIPTYNASKSIERCLDSIVNQTYKNIEIITCDDCSKDNTVDIVRGYFNQRKITIISLVNEKNEGAAYSRNRCIKEAHGKYIAQIDDDDYCAPTRIEKQVVFLENNNKYDICGSGLFFFDESGIWGKSNYSKDFAPQGRDFLWNSCFYNPTTMITKESLQKVGGYRVAKETRRGQDYDLFMRLYAAGYCGFVLCEELTYYYRGCDNYKKCKYRYRIDEAVIRYKNFKAMGFLPLAFIFVLKPLVIGLLPISLLERMKINRLHK